MIALEKVAFPIDASEFSEIIDVRSPAEFADDHVPGAINLPALSNEQRAEVGTLDKQVSPFHARRLGARYITENLSHHLGTALADRDKSFAPLVYCWRGGMRSQSIATVLRSIGWRARIIDGGYKAYRTHVIARLTELLDDTPLDLRTFAGLTGVGKTRLLHALDAAGAQVLDLEGLANHKGSLLGSHPTNPQPSQRSFESQLLAKLSSFDLSRPIWTEAESSKIGKIQCPPPLWRALGKSRIFEIEVPLDARATLLAEDYPHFFSQTKDLKQNLDHLRALRGHTQIDQWHQQIDGEDWPAFIASVLRDHYDLCYRTPGADGSNYSPPQETISLPDATHATFANLAKQLVE